MGDSKMRTGMTGIFGLARFFLYFCVQNKFNMKTIISSPKAPAAIGPYSQAVEANGLLFVSGQLPVNPTSGEMPESIEAQTRQSLDNLSAILEEAGLSVSDVVKTTVLLSNIADFAAMNAVYAEYFPSEAPARVCYQVAALPKGAMVEIEAIAMLPTEKA